MIGVALTVGLLHQLVRRGRTRVTESLADTLVAVVLVVSAASLIALRMAGGGRDAVVVCLAAGAGRAAARPAWATASCPGLPSPSAPTAAGPAWCSRLGVGSMAAVAAAGDTGPVAGTRALLLGLAIAATVSAGDLAVDLGAAELTAGRRDARRVSALMPAGLVLPFAALAPVAYVAGRLVLA